MTSDQNSCTVRGTLAVVLRLSNIHGVAPLNIKAHGDTYIIRASKPKVYTWIFLILIIGTILIGLIMDLQHYKTQTAVRVKTTSALIVWLGDLATLMMVTFVGVCQGETRMKRILRLLKDIEKIKEKIGRDHKNPKERVFTVCVIALLIYIYITVLMDFGVYILDAYVNKKEKVVVYIYGLVYFGYIHTLLLIMQVIFVVLAIHSTFKTINNCLRNLIDLYKVKSKQLEVKKQKLLTVSNIIRPVDITNRWISKLDITSAHESIEDLADSYLLLCKVVESFNEENGFLILLLIGSYIEYTFISNYYMIRDLCSPDLFNAWKNVTSILIPTVWTVFRLIEFFTLIESFHRTHEEMNETHILLSKVIHITTPVGYMITPILDTFYKQLVLYRPSFSPLYICTMHRSQIAAIIAGFTTYMAVIIQYHLIEECKA